MRHKIKIFFSVLWTFILISWNYINWYMVNQYGKQLYGNFHQDLLAIFLIGTYIVSLVSHSLIVFQGGSIVFRFIKGVLSVLNLMVQGYVTLILLMGNNGSV